MLRRRDSRTHLCPRRKCRSDDKFSINDRVVRRFLPGKNAR